MKPILRYHENHYHSYQVTEHFKLSKITFQVYGQPIYAKYETLLSNKWPESPFIHKVYKLPLPFTKGKSFNFTMCKLVLRTAFVVLTTLISLMLPFFNAILGLLGSVAFWPITVYFPVTMYITQASIKRKEARWWGLQALNCGALIVSLLAAVGSVAGMAQQLKHVTMFNTEL